jgi:hypothetical protein
MKNAFIFTKSSSLGKNFPLRSPVSGAEQMPARRECRQAHPDSIIWRVQLRSAARRDQLEFGSYPAHCAITNRVITSKAQPSFEEFQIAFICTGFI